LTPPMEDSLSSRLKPESANGSDFPFSYCGNFLSGTEATEMFATLHYTIPWRSEAITLFGKRMMQPRLVAFVADQGVSYTYSGQTMQRNDWTPELLLLRKRVELVSGVSFNSVLCNLYRSGSDSMGWHSDDEKSLGQNPIIASVSLGESRVFKFRKKEVKNACVSMILGHGSLLLMTGDCQHSWQHSVPKTRKFVRPRINLTFRKVVF
jgi:alkylated DNA repair dioxygenase AlkB